MVKKYLCLHADDGLLASTREEREKLVKKLEEKVKVQVSSPLYEIGSSIEFLKRKYIMSEEGSLVYSDRKRVEHLKKVMPVKERDAPADGSFLQEDKSPPLEPSKAKLFREMTGRLLYLASTRPDIQFAVSAPR